MSKNFQHFLLFFLLFHIIGSLILNLIEYVECSSQMICSYGFGVPGPFFYYTSVLGNDYGESWHFFFPYEGILYYIWIFLGFLFPSILFATYYWWNRKFLGKLFLILSIVVMMILPLVTVVVYGFLEEFACIGRSSSCNG